MVCPGFGDFTSCCFGRTLHFRPEMKIHMSKNDCYVGAPGCCLEMGSLGLFRSSLSEFEGILTFSKKNSDLIIWTFRGSNFLSLIWIIFIINMNNFLDFLEWDLFFLKCLSLPLSQHCPAPWSRCRKEPAISITLLWSERTWLSSKGKNVSLQFISMFKLY